MAAFRTLESANREIDLLRAQLNAAKLAWKRAVDERDRLRGAVGHAARTETPVPAPDQGERAPAPGEDAGTAV